MPKQQDYQGKQFTVSKMISQVLQRHWKTGGVKVGSTRQVNKRGELLMDTGNFKLERRPNVLLSYLDEIQQLADLERDALGFWPKQQLREAIERQRLWALLDANTLKGFLIYSGVFPHAKIQGIATTISARKQGVAACLMRSFSAELERLGYISIKAEVASDLDNALKFYASQGFEPHSTKQGGKARNRTIIVHTLELETDTLFSVTDAQDSDFDLGFRRRLASETPFYAFDLNVYLDLVKDRSQSEDARKLFSAALSHQIRLAVTKEFVVELQRNSGNAPANDPVLQLALRLPQMPSADGIRLKTFSTQIHDLVFGQTTGNKPATDQSKSDAVHLAHAALAQASAFVTRDRAILEAREVLLEKVGIDVINVKELVDLLPVQTDAVDNRSTAIIGHGFKVSARSDSELRQYLLDNHTPSVLVDEFCSYSTVDTHQVSVAIQLTNKIVALGILLVPKKMEPTARLLIHTQPENPNCELFTDHILDKLTRHACETLPTEISLAYLPGQPVVRKYARLRGFFKSSATKDLLKIALGRPITCNTWAAISDTLRRRTGFMLPEHSPETFSTAITVTNREKKTYEVQPIGLENILSPSIVICPERSSVLVPIRRIYADKLLGTSKQSNFDFIEEKDASFVALRSYANSPHTASAMKPHLPVLFYESLPQNGRGAVVAIARIVDVSVVQKKDIPSHWLRRLVVDNIDDFSASDEVLLTTFDNLLEFPNPVPFSRIRQVGAAKASLVAPEAIDSTQTTQILSWGWAGV